jgi:hypothetical protein
LAAPNTAKAESPSASGQSPDQPDEGADGRSDDQVGGIAHPEDRLAEQQVANRAAAEASDGGEEDEGDDVVLAPCGRERAAGCEERDAGVEQQGGEGEMDHRRHGGARLRKAPQHSPRRSGDPRP